MGRVKNSSPTRRVPKKRKQKKVFDFQSYIRDLIKTELPTKSPTKELLVSMNGIVEKIIRDCTENACIISTLTGHKTISPSHLEAVIKIKYPPVLTYNILEAVKNDMKQARRRKQAMKRSVATMSRELETPKSPESDSTIPKSPDNKTVDEK